MPKTTRKKSTIQTQQIEDEFATTPSTPVTEHEAELPDLIDEELEELEAEKSHLEKEARRARLKQEIEDLRKQAVHRESRHEEAMSPLELLHAGDSVPVPAPPKPTQGGVYASEQGPHKSSLLTKALPTFSAESSENVEEFLRQLHLFAAITNTPNTLALYAAARGKVKEWLTRLWTESPAMRDDWGKTTAAMRIRFPPSAQLQFYRVVSDPPPNLLVALDQFQAAADREGLDIESDQNKRMLLHLIGKSDDILAKTLTALSIGSNAISSSEIIERARYTVQTRTPIQRRPAAPRAQAAASEHKPPHCDYCHKEGHVIQECRRKQFFDAKALGPDNPKQTAGQQQRPSNPNPNPPSRTHTIAAFTYEGSQVDNDVVRWDSQAEVSLIDRSLVQEEDIRPAPDARISSILQENAQVHGTTTSLVNVNGDVMEFSALVTDLREPIVLIGKDAQQHMAAHLDLEHNSVTIGAVRQKDPIVHALEEAVQASDFPADFKGQLLDLVLSYSDRFADSLILVTIHHVARGHTKQAHQRRNASSSKSTNYCKLGTSGHQHLPGHLQCC